MYWNIIWNDQNSSLIAHYYGEKEGEMREREGGRGERKRGESGREERGDRERGRDERELGERDIDVGTITESIVGVKQ